MSNITTKEQAKQRIIELYKSDGIIIAKYWENSEEARKLCKKFDLKWDEVILGRKE